MRYLVWCLTSNKHSIISEVKERIWSVLNKYYYRGKKRYINQITETLRRIRKLQDNTYLKERKLG